MDKYDIFISYRREGGEHLGKMLRDSLVEKGYKVFFDVDSLVSGEFNTALYEVIEGCKDFILICTPNALDRCNTEGDWVYQEIERAMALNKNIIPIMARSFSFPDVLPPAIDGVRWQNGLEANMEFYDAFIQRLQTFMKSKPAASIKYKKPLIIVPVVILLIALGVMAYFIIQNNLEKNSIHQSDSSNEKITEKEDESTDEKVPSKDVETPLDVHDENDVPEIDLQELQGEVVEYLYGNLSVVDLHYSTFRDCLSIFDLYLSGEISYGKAKNNISITKSKLDYADITITEINSELVDKLDAAAVNGDDITVYASRCEASCEEYVDFIDAMITILDNPGFDLISIQSIRDSMEAFGELEKDTTCEYYNLALIKFDNITENEINLSDGNTILTDYVWEKDEAVLKAAISDKLAQKQEILDIIAF